MNVVIVQLDGMAYTGVDTFATAIAFGFSDHEFREGINGLRVGAPLTFQRAALEEHGGPDSRAIVNAIPLDVEHQPLCPALMCLGVGGSHIALFQ
jgi:hypothetical protein